MPTDFKNARPNVPATQTPYQAPPPLRPDPYRLDGMHEREHGGMFVQPCRWDCAQKQKGLAPTKEPADTIGVPRASVVAATN